MCMWWDDVWRLETLQRGLPHNTEADDILTSVSDILLMPQSRWGTRGVGSLVGDGKDDWSCIITLRLLFHCFHFNQNSSIIQSYQGESTEQRTIWFGVYRKNKGHKMLYCWELIVILSSWGSRWVYRSWCGISSWCTEDESTDVCILEGCTFRFASFEWCGSPALQRPGISVKLPTSFLEFVGSLGLVGMTKLVFKEEGLSGFYGGVVGVMIGQGHIAEHKVLLL